MTDFSTSEPLDSSRDGDLFYRELPGQPFRPVALPGERFRIGRRFENDLILSHASVSRFHAEIVRDDEGWAVVDCGSKFGTFLNGQRITRAQLNSGDEIRVGKDDGPVIIFRPSEPRGEIDELSDSTPPEGHIWVRQYSDSAIVSAAAQPAEAPDAAMWLVERFRATSLIGDYHEALTVVADAAIELTDFDRVVLFLASQNGPDGAVPQPQLVRGRSGQAMPVQAGREVDFVCAVMASGKLVSFAPEAERSAGDHRALEHARAADLDRAVCVPLRTLSAANLSATGDAQWTTVGALYLEGKRESPPIGERAMTVIESLAGEAGLVADRLYARQSHIARIKARWDVEAATEAKRLKTAATLAERARITCSLANYLASTGDLDGASLVLVPFEDASARAQLPETVRVEVLEAIGGVLLWQGQWHRATGIFNAALDAAAEARNLEIDMRLRPSLARVNAEIGELGIAREHALTALSFLRRSDDASATYGRALIALGIVEQRDGDLTSAAHSFRQGVRVLERTEDLVGQSSAYLWLGSVQAERGDTSDAITSFQHLLEIAQPLGNPLYLLLGLSALARCLVRSGAWRRAETVIATGLGVESRPLTEREHGALLLLSAMISVWRDGGDGARDAIDRVRRYALATGNQAIEAEASLLEAELEIESRNLPAARNALTVVGALAETIKQPDLIVRMHLGVAEVERRLGEYNAADQQVVLAQRFVDSQSNLALAGLLHRTLGKLNADRTRFTEAQHSLAQSLSIFRTIDDRRQIALVHLDLGHLMLAAGDPACGRTHLQQARDAFVELGIPSALKSAEAGIVQAIASGNASSPASYSSILLGPTSEPRFVRRILDATQSRSLLLRELTSIAIDIGRATSAVVLSCGSDGTLEIAAASGIEEPPVPSVLLALRAAMGETVHDGDLTLYPIEVLQPGLKDGGIATLLAVNQAVTAGSRTDRVLTLVVQLARQGLDLLSLRSSLKRAELPDPTRIGGSDDSAGSSMMGGGGFVYTSPSMRLLADKLQRIRTSTATVLITGESGVGKELVARAVHAASPRARAPFVPFNCSTALREMVESQLFGHKRGAFTGATSDNTGMARAARNGTLFLDEVGDLPFEMQPKLLRFLELGEIQPLGESTPQHVDVRVVAATNADLERSVEEKRFREDLFHRLNIIRLHVPPLRERRDDIPLLVSHFLILCADRFKYDRPPSISQEVLDRMIAYSWPGNVRQLRNEIERLVTFSQSGATITRDMLSEELQDFVPAPMRYVAPPAARPYDSAALSLPERLKLFEIEHITQALNESGSNLTRASATLGMARQNLQRRLKKLGLKGGE